ncbi:MAG: S53 family peptidase [Bacteroidota bacterium]
MSVPEFAAEVFVPSAGSKRNIPDAVRLNTLEKELPIEICLLVRRRQPFLQRSNSVITRELYEKKHGAEEGDIALVAAFAHQYHLSVSAIQIAERMIYLKGKISDMEKAFHVSLSHYRDTRGHLFRGRTGDIYLPATLEKIVEGVFGLDDRPAVSPKFQVAKRNGRIINHEASQYSFFPDELAQLYGFPADYNGEGQTIALIELGGGYRIADLRRYFKSLDLPLPQIRSVSIDGGYNDPSTADSADGEVMLDIEIAGAVAPGANIIVYFAPNTDKGFLAAINAAIHDKLNKPSIVSISWGAAEKNWTVQSLRAYNDVFHAATVLGITVCAAAGDYGSADGERDGQVHVDFPSSSPFVLACGGTKLTVLGTAITGETVWHSTDRAATGGGVSDVFALPEYQQKAGVPVSLNSGFRGRGVPDLAANADPDTGYRVVVDGQQLVIGGTSAVAPLMSGLIARINQQKGKPMGFLHPKLYNGGFRYRDVTVGNNITTPTRKGYEAGIGWDACTGWGIVSGLK